jgi:lysozyme
MHSKLIEKIKMEEGDKACMYKCPAGKWTIGAGINLEAQEMPQEVLDKWKSVNRNNWTFHLFSGGNMPQEVRDAWLGFILNKTEETLAFDCREFPLFTESDDAYIVIVDMAYQMGVSGYSKFIKMRQALWDGDYNLAAKELLDSNYHRQLKSYVKDEETETRSERNAELLRGCE